MLNRLLPTITCLLLMTSYASAQGEPCLPALQPDTVALDRDTVVNLVLLDERLQTAAESEKTGIFGSYGDSNFGYDDAGEASSMLKTLLKIDYNEQEKTTLRLSTLSSNAVDAYVACVAAREGGIELPYVLSSGVSKGDTFFLTFYWRPKDRPDEATAQAQLIISQGSFQGGQSELTVDVSDREAKVVSVTRNRFAPSEIAIVVPGADPVIVPIPALPTHEILTGVLRGDRFVSDTRETSGDIGRTLCVELPNDVTDTAIIPGSYRINFERWQRSGVTLDPNETKPKPDALTVESARRACAQLKVQFDTVFSSFANITADAVVETWRSAPTAAALAAAQANP